MFELKDYLDRLEALVNTESGSLNAAGITRVADQLAGWYKELGGWQVTYHHLDDRTGPLLEITNKPGAERYDVTFVGHMDTVFPDGTVAKRPFTKDEENCYGPGVGDMKDGDVAMYEIAKNLSKDTLDKLAICMAYNPDEEIGSVYSREELDRIAAKSDYIFVMESAGGRGEKHCFARKGMVAYDLEFTGKAGHAGFMFELDVASAVEEMGHWILDLCALASREDNTTVNVGVAQGGTAVNVVPEHAVLRMESRFVKYSERDRVEKAIQAMLNTPCKVEGVTVKAIAHRQSPPWVRTEKAQAYYDHIYKLAEQAGLPFTDKDRGGLSDANHMSQFGAICLDGMGPHGALDHSDKEYSVIESAEYCVKLCSLLLDDLAKNK